MIAVSECDKCGADSGVRDSRLSPTGHIRRSRECVACEHRWTTYESRDPGDMGPVRDKLDSVSKALSEVYTTMADVAPKPRVRRR